MRLRLRMRARAHLRAHKRTSRRWHTPAKKITIRVVAVVRCQDVIERRRGAALLAQRLPADVNPATLMELSLEGAGVATLDLSPFVNLQRLKCVG